MKVKAIESREFENIARTAGEVFEIENMETARQFITQGFIESVSQVSEKKEKPKKEGK